MSALKYPVHIPRHASGIRSQEVRAGMLHNWWFMRWMSSVEAMNLGARFGRGGNYARTGQVVELNFAGNVVTAKVVGTRQGAYDVGIDFRAPEGDARKRIVAALRAEPMLAARMLANELPTEVEEIFSREGYDLFPGRKLGERLYDTATACTCPDYANPCKHSVAVLLLLGEEIANRPTRLLELRGIPMKEILP